MNTTLDTVGAAAVPDRWQVVRLADLPCRVIDCHHSTPAWVPSGPVVIRNHNIRHGTLDLTNPSYTDESDFAQRVRRATPTHPDLVITREAPMGQVCMIPPGLRCCLGQRMVLLRIDGDTATCQYVLYALQSERVQRFISVAGGTGSTVSNLRIPVLKDLPVLIPPPTEQRAIAEALSDADALLDGLDRLIAKKRDLKQATMQQLLTGKTRLPGFSGEWAVGSLDMVTSRATGVWGNHEPDERNSRRAEIIRAGDISQDGKLTTTANRYVAPAEFEKAKCDLDDLVITTSGNGLGKLWWCDGRSDVAASNFVRVLQPIKGKAIGRFLYYALRTCEGSRQLQQHTATSAYPNLRPTYFSTSWISLPPLPEQAAIAAVLSDMDAELDVLEARREKVASLKHAMMQELLTGKTRLVAPEAAHA